MPVDQHYTTQFTTNWIHRLQQTKQRLASFIEWDTFDGQRKRYDRLGAQNSQLKTERNAPTPIQDVSSDSRWAVRKSYQLANLLDEDDAAKLGTLVLPASDYVKQHAATYHRNSDDILWEAASGSVLTGQDGTTSTPLPDAQKIVHGSKNLTLAKLITLNEKFEDADLEDEAPRVLVITASQITSLLNTTKVTSADYATVKALATGTIDTFMGFKFVKIKRLPKSGNIRTCVAFAKGSIRGFMGMKKTKISEREDLSYGMQIYSSWHLGAVRVHDESVVTVECDESVSGD
jgi:hypothetical protein